MEVYWVNIRNVDVVHHYFNMVPNFEPIYLVFLTTPLVVAVVVLGIDGCTLNCVCRYALTPVSRSFQV